jgi:hypothetical protein
VLDDRTYLVMYAGGNEQNPYWNYRSFILSSQSQGTDIRIDLVRDADAALPFSVDLKSKFAGFNLTEPVTWSATEAGWKGDYFSDLKFTNLALSRTDLTTYFSWGGSAPSPEVPADFSARWTGWITPPVSETYQFYSEVQDSAKVWIDGKFVFEGGWGNWSPYVNLVGGVPVPIQIDFKDYSGEAYMRLKWQSPSVPHNSIPLTSMTRSLSSEV